MCSLTLAQYKIQGDLAHSHCTVRCVSTGDLTRFGFQLSPSGLRRAGGRSRFRFRVGDDFQPVLHPLVPSSLEGPLIQRYIDGLLDLFVMAGYDRLASN